MTLTALLFGIVLGIQRGLAPCALSDYLRRTTKTFPGRLGGLRKFFAPAFPDLFVCFILVIILAATSFCRGLPVLLAGCVLVYRGAREARFRKKADDLQRTATRGSFPFRSPRSFVQAAINDFASPRLYLDSLMVSGPLYMAFPSVVSFTGNLLWFFLIYFTTLSVVRYGLTVIRQRFRIRAISRAKQSNKQLPERDFRHFDMPDYLFSLILIGMGIYFMFLGGWSLFAGMSASLIPATFDKEPPGAGHESA